MKALAVAKRAKRAIAANRVMMMCELRVLCVLRLCHLCACTKIDLSPKNRSEISSAVARILVVRAYE